MSKKENADTKGAQPEQLVAGLLSPTPGCECETCRAIRARGPERLKRDLRACSSQALATALSECRNALVRVLGWPLPQATVEDALPPWLSKQARDAAQPPSEAAKGMPPAQGNCPAPTESNLPERIVVGANGAYWRYFEPDGVGTTEPFYSMCPVSSDNDPVEPVAVYVRQAPSEAKGEWNTRRYGWNPVSKADVMPCSSQGRSGDAESASETFRGQTPE